MGHTAAAGETAPKAAHAGNHGGHGIQKHRTANGNRLAELISQSIVSPSVGTDPASEMYFPIIGELDDVVQRLDWMCWQHTGAYGKFNGRACRATLHRAA